MHPVDFQGNYDMTSHIISIGTPAYLIASKAIRYDDALRMLMSIDHHKDDIYKRLKIDTGSYKSCCLDTACNLPLDELGFLTPFKNELKTVVGIESKELFSFLLSAFALFFPVFRFIISVASWIKKRRLNMEMDNIIQNTNQEEPFKNFKNLKKQVVDSYGKGLLLEAHYNSLKDRINMYLDEFKKSSEESLEILPADHFIINPA
jgi:hypothetical protein